MSPLDATNASFIMGFIVFVSSRRDTASQYSEGRYISVSRLRYSANHNALDSNVFIQHHMTPLHYHSSILQTFHEDYKYLYCHFWSVYYIIAEKKEFILQIIIILNSNFLDSSVCFSLELGGFWVQFLFVVLGRCGHPQFYHKLACSNMYKEEERTEGNLPAGPLRLSACAF